MRISDRRFATRCYWETFDVALRIIYVSFKPPRIREDLGPRPHRASAGQHRWMDSRGSALPATRHVYDVCRPQTPQGVRRAAQVGGQSWLCAPRDTACLRCLPAPDPTGRPQGSTGGWTVVALPARLAYAQGLDCLWGGIGLVVSSGVHAKNGPRYPVTAERPPS